jgi:ribose transport system substrate-binding protein
MASGELTIVVADTLPMQLEQTRDGLGNGLVGQRPFEMGYKAMFILKDIVEGRAVDDPIYTGLDVCTNDNIATCVN